MCDENSRAHDRALKDTGYFFLLSHDLRYCNDVIYNFLLFIYRLLIYQIL